MLVDSFMSVSNEELFSDFFLLFDINYENWFGFQAGIGERSFMSSTYCLVAQVFSDRLPSLVGLKPTTMWSEVESFLPLSHSQNIKNELILPSALFQNMWGIV